MTYTCAVCGETFESGWSNEEAYAELAEKFPGFTPEDCVLLCGDCYEQNFKEKPDAP